MICCQFCHGTYENGQFHNCMAQSSLSGFLNQIGGGAVQYRDPRDANIEAKARLVIEMWDAFTTQDEPWSLTPAIEYLRKALEVK